MPSDYKPSYEDVFFVVYMEENEYEDAGDESAGLAMAAAGDINARSKLHPDAPRDPQAMKWASEVLDQGTHIITDPETKALMMIAAPHAAARIQMNQADELRGAGTDDTESMYKLAAATARDEYSQALDRARTANLEDAISLIRSDVTADLNDGYLDEAPDNFDDHDWLDQRVQTPAVRDARTVKPKMQPQSQDMRELRGALPDGVSLRQSGYSDVY